MFKYQGLYPYSQTMETFYFGNLLGYTLFIQVKLVQGGTKCGIRVEWCVWLWLLSIFLALNGWAQAAPAQPQTRSWYNSYQVFAFNDLGMHCYDNDFSVFSLLPLFNVVHAQVIYKGTKPQLLTDSTFKVTYAATYDLNGSINTTSIGKTNFWDYRHQALRMTPAPGRGFWGIKCPATASGPKPWPSIPVTNGSAPPAFPDQHR